MGGDGGAMKQRERAGQKLSRWVIVADSYGEGVSVAKVTNPGADTWRYPLSIGADLEPGVLRSRYLLRSEHTLARFEGQLRVWAARGILQDSVLVLGTVTDPFHPFDEKFRASMSLVELLSHWTPGRVIVQTRSPLLAIALPALRALGSRLWVSVAIETLDESVVRAYTPELPSAQERLKLVRTLKRFGIRTGVQLGPVLPYGEWTSDAPAFVDAAVAEADYVTVHAVSEMAERLGKGSAEARIAARLADERRFHWLRRDAVRPLISRLEQAGVEYTTGGIEMTRLPERQLGLFDQG
jgi:hypothetical protein